jgi:hypothetical protein
LTINETRIFQAILEAGQFQELQANWAIAQLTCNTHLVQVLAMILLISRDDPTWTLELVQILEPATVSALAEFFLNKHNR